MVSRQHGLLHQGVDLAAGWGMNAAQQANHDTGIGYGMFGSVSDGWSRYDTGMDEIGFNLQAFYSHAAVA
ncbi:MAG: hypothetical protein FWD79_10235 [Desulfobulbus sp.]|nr:hypothetical protein [Desulfobulbus sp.]